MACVNLSLSASNSLRISSMFMGTDCNRTSSKPCCRTTYASARHSSKYESKMVPAEERFSAHGLHLNISCEISWIAQPFATLRPSSPRHAIPPLEGHDQAETRLSPGQKHPRP